ncbi:hypothetical protein [Streptomyces sp. NPDC007088]
MDLMSMPFGAGVSVLLSLFSTVVLIAVAHPDPGMRDRAFRVLRILFS